MVLDMIDSVTGNILHNKDISIHVLLAQEVGLLLPLPQQPLYLFLKVVCAIPCKAHGNVSHQMYVSQQEAKEDVAQQEPNGKIIHARHQYNQLQIQLQLRLQPTLPQSQLMARATIIFQHRISIRYAELVVHAWDPKF
jgi:hypothetical protein